MITFLYHFYKFFVIKYCLFYIIIFLLILLKFQNLQAILKTIFLYPFKSCIFSRYPFSKKMPLYIKGYLRRFYWLCISIF
nr:MAG TPA: hypothetical protein [Caudoviricetes sp.]